MREQDIKFGTEANDIKHISILARRSIDKKNTILKKVYIEYNDGRVEVMKRGLMSQKRFNKKINELLKSAGASKVPGEDYEVAEYKNEKIDMFNRLNETYRSQRTTRVNEFDLTLPDELLVSNVKVADDEVFEDEDIKVTRDSKPKKAAITFGAIGLAAALASCGLVSNSKTEEEQAQPEIIETVAETQDITIGAPTVNEATKKLSLDGQDWAYYAENATECNQKTYMSSINDYVMNINRSQPWMYEKLTEEMISELKETGFSMDGDEAIFGFTAEDIHNMNLVFGDYTNEQYTEIMNGDYIDIAKVINDSESGLNQALRKVQFYYINSDNAHLGMENVIPFTGNGAADIVRFEDELQEYKDLIIDGKYDDAEAKMKEIKHDLLEYAHAQDLEQNTAKAYILRTILPACSYYSVGYQYKDTITLHLYDKVENDYDDLEVTTALFDEITMRDLVEGYKECKNDQGVVYQEGFDAVEFLRQFDTKTTKYSERYTLVVSDNGVSIADEFVGGLVNKLETANDFMQRIREENATVDGIISVKDDIASQIISELNAANTNLNITYQGSGVVNTSDNSQFDTLTKDGYNTDTVLNLINNNLKAENKYPKNISFFSSNLSKFGKEIWAFVERVSSKLGINNTAKKENKNIVKVIPGYSYYVPGETITTTTTETTVETSSETHTETRHNDDWEKELEKEEEKAKETAEKKSDDAQDIYDRVLNGEDVAKTGDEAIDNAIDAAKEDKEKIQKALDEIGASEVGEHVISGGEVHPEETDENGNSLEDAVIEDEAKDPVDSKDNTTKHHETIEDLTENESLDEIKDDVKKKVEDATKDPNATTETNTSTDKDGNKTTETTITTEDGDTIKVTETESADGKKSETKTETTQVIDGEEVEVTISETHEDTGNYTEEEVNKDSQDTSNTKPQNNDSSATQPTQDTKPAESTKPAENTQPVKPETPAKEEEKATEATNDTNKVVNEGEGFTSTDPTKADTFAPVVDTTTPEVAQPTAQSYVMPTAEEIQAAIDAANALNQQNNQDSSYNIDPEFADLFSEEEIDSIIESLAEEAPVDENTQGMSK